MRFDFAGSIQFVDTIPVGSYPYFVIVVFQDSKTTFIANIFVGVEWIETNIVEYLVFERNHQYTLLIEGNPDVVLLILKNAVNFCIPHIEID